MERLVTNTQECNNFVFRNRLQTQQLFIQMGPALKTHIFRLYAFIHVLEVNWECFGSTCYWIPTLQDPKTKSEADAVCEAMGAHVAAPETTEEQEFVHQLVYASGMYLNFSLLDGC